MASTKGNSKWFLLRLLWLWNIIYIQSVFCYIIAPRRLDVYLCLNDGATEMFIRGKCSGCGNEFEAPGYTPLNAGKEMPDMGIQIVDFDAETDLITVACTKCGSRTELSWNSDDGVYTSADGKD